MSDMLSWTHLRHAIYGLLIAAGVGALEQAEQMDLGGLPGPLTPILGILIGWALGHLRTLEAKEADK